MVVSKILPRCAKCLLITPMTSSFSELHPISQRIWSLRIQNERTRHGYVCSRSYDPAECLAEVMQSEIYPRFYEQFRTLDHIKVDCRAEELAQGLLLVILMKDTGLEKDSPSIVPRVYYEPLTSSTSDVKTPPPLSHSSYLLSLSNDNYWHKSSNHQKNISQSQQLPIIPCQLHGL